MRPQVYLGIFLVFVGTMLPICAAAQSDGAVSLGDLARSIRQRKEPNEPAAANVIDNDNLSQVITDVEKLRLTATPMFSFDGKGKNFKMSSPDGTCSLSFNANTTALLSSPYVAQDLPQNELAKLDGPANIQGDTLEVSMYNPTAWNVKEITVGLTIVRPDDPTAENYGTAKLLPATVGETVTADKRSDMTLLLHLKASAAPLATTVFREKLDATLQDGQEWHWAIVEAKGIPPAPDASNASVADPPTTEVIPASAADDQPSGR
jgi:hypothetical protein